MVMAIALLAAIVAGNMLLRGGVGRPRVWRLGTLRLCSGCFGMRGRRVRFGANLRALGLDGGRSSLLGRPRLQPHFGMLGVGGRLRLVVLGLPCRLLLLLLRLRYALCLAMRRLSGLLRLAMLRERGMRLCLTRGDLLLRGTRTMNIPLCRLRMRRLGRACG